MKFLVLSAVIASQVSFFARQAACQENRSQPERLHVTRPFPWSSPGRVELTASSIERDLSSKESESILHLRGSVEVRMITCGPISGGAKMICDNGSMVLHADAVDYNEKTGEIQAHGDVHISPYQTASRTVSK
jgi:lipopolysaccharide assembly outer membrane protein LptD (OstA)